MRVVGETLADAELAEPVKGRVDGLNQAGVDELYGASIVYLLNSQVQLVYQLLLLDDNVFFHKFIDGRNHNEVCVNEFLKQTAQEFNNGGAGLHEFQLTGGLNEFNDSVLLRQLDFLLDELINPIILLLTLTWTVKEIAVQRNELIVKDILNHQKVLLENVATYNLLASLQLREQKGMDQH